MKHVIIMLALASMPFFGLAQAAEADQTTTDQPVATAEQTTQPATTAPDTKTAAKPAAAEDDEPGIALCLARGLCNITTGWLELPRCIIYDNSAIPVFGLIVGIPEGAVFTVARELCGVFDILSFGTTGSLCHGKVFPDTVFQSKWSPEKK